MSDLASKIAADNVPEGCLAVYWLSQAGFVFKAHSGVVVYTDPYLSDVVEKEFGFKRMMTCPIKPEEVKAHLIACTHEHLDHMDTDALPIIAKDPSTHFAGPIACVKEFLKMDIPEERHHLLVEGEKIVVDGVTVTAVYADHGDLAPDAVGLFLDFEGIRVYHTGDTAYRPERLGPVINMHPDVVIPCINGRYGNMDAEEAAHLTQVINPRVSIASHFWMFVEHNGDPGLFLESCAKVAPGVQALVMKPGERYLLQPS